MSPHFMLMASDAPQWYETWAGVLAIPAAVLSIVGAPILIRKANLESQKTKLEIEEKKQALAAAKQGAASSSETAQQQLVELVGPPLLESRRVQDITLRFIVLFLALQAWNFAEQILAFLPVGFGAVALWFGENVFLYVVYVALQQLPQVGFYIVVVGLGAPLLMDILDHFGGAPSWARALRQPPWWLFVLVSLVVVVAGIGTRFTP